MASKFVPLVLVVGFLLSSSPRVTASELHVADTRSCITDGFLPPNSLKIGPSAFGATNVTEEKFNSVLNRIENFYRPVFAKRGARLVVQRSWSDGTVNAYADQSGTDWYIKMFGGMARHPAITADGFLLIACHEIGHHLGGAPKYPGRWASNEGQSDYFATLKCLREMFAPDDNVEIVRTLNVPAAVTRNCESSFGSAGEIAICSRSAMAGFAAAKVMQALGGSPNIAFGTPDPRVVSATDDRHPAAQCRLDTYYGGAICPVAASEPLSNTNPNVGTCAVETGAKRGTRPLCWYRPSGSAPNPNPNPTPTPTNPPTPTGIANAPTIRGSDVVTNINARLEFTYDVSSFPGAKGIWLEFTRPNRDFSEPNGVNPDPGRALGAALAGNRGGFFIIPATQLPGWGNYSVRIIPLDSTGRRAVGKFSNAKRFTLRSGR